MRHIGLLIGSLLIAVTITSCSKRASIPIPEQLTLYSIEGTERYHPKYTEEGTPEPEPDNLLYKYPILGQVTLKEPADIREICQALDDGMNENATPARCFIPRHAIRIVENGQTKDYLICFECQRIYIYIDGKHHESKTTSGSPQRILNKYLRDNQIPLAKSCD